MSNIFLKSALRADAGKTAGKTAAQRGPLPGQLVYLLVEVGDTSLRRKLHMLDLLQTKQHDQVVIRPLKV